MCNGSLKRTCGKPNIDEFQCSLVNGHVATPASYIVVPFLLILFKDLFYNVWWIFLYEAYRLIIDFESFVVFMTKLCLLIAGSDPEMGSCCNCLRNSLSSILGEEEDLVIFRIDPILEYLFCFFTPAL